MASIRSDWVKLFRFETFEVLLVNYKISTKLMRNLFIILQNIRNDLFAADM